jgi:diguanylate cyclase (GGDEF)-like protein
VNDTLGHAAGDQLLTVVADRVRACVRAGDAVARLGGDEFVVLREHTDAATGQAVHDRLAETLRRPVVLDGGRAPLSASIGMVTATGPSIDDGATLLSRADAAMYEAKRTSHRARAAVAR